MLTLSVKTIGERIREVRKNCGWLQKDLAEKIGIARSVIPEMEAGKRQNINTDTLNSIATATNTPVHVLLGFDVRTLAMEAIRGQAPELAAQIKKEGLASLTDEKCRAIVRIVLE